MWPSSAEYWHRGESWGVSVEDAERGLEEGRGYHDAVVEG